ncbi:MAG: DUF6470 family protein [Negativicutes bacterium]|nr:DUF6470 family protein [Negativicutes bacterium]
MLLIDQTPCRASYGLKTQAQFLADTSDQGKQTVLDNISRIATDGDRLSQIQNSGNTFPEMAYEASFTPAPDIYLAYIARPDFQYIPPTGSNVDTSA